MSCKLYAKCAVTLCCLIYSNTLSFAALPNSIQASQQKKLSSIRVNKTSDGFTGTYRDDQNTLLFSAKKPSKDKATSKIQRADGMTLIEVTRDDKNFVFKFQGGTLKIDTQTQALVNPTNEDLQALEKFVKSSDATLVRKCIAALIKEKAELKKHSITPLSFILVGMLLGDEPVVSTLRSDEKPLNSLIWQSVAYSPPKSITAKSNTKTVTTNSLSKATKTDNKTGTVTVSQPQDGFGGNECNGCCGGGCWSCSGYYTYECLAHDNCVTSMGHPACVGIFPAAAASLIRAIENGGGDWGPCLRCDQPDEGGGVF